MLTDRCLGTQRRRFNLRFLGKIREGVNKNLFFYGHAFFLLFLSIDSEWSKTYDFDRKNPK